MKFILPLCIALITACSSKSTISLDSSFTNDINKSIIEDFYNGDTTNISNNIYLLHNY
jgi:hypothetical protein